MNIIKLKPAYSREILKLPLKLKAKVKTSNNSLRRITKEIVKSEELIVIRVRKVKEKVLKNSRILGDRTRNILFYE